MFRLTVNLGGILDLFVSEGAPPGLRNFDPPTCETETCVDDIVLIPIRYVQGADYGRPRNLLLMTSSSMSKGERNRLRDSLIELLGGDFDRVMAARNREQVADARTRIIEVCERLEYGKLEIPDSGSGFPSARKSEGRSVLVQRLDNGGGDKRGDYDEASATEQGKSFGLGPVEPSSMKRTRRKRVRESTGVLPIAVCLCVLAALLNVGFSIFLYLQVGGMALLDNATYQGFPSLVAFMNARIARMDSALSDGQKSLSDQIQDTAESLDMVSAQLNSLGTRMGNAEIGLAAARGTADALDARMGSAETGLAAARETADALDARMGSAETDLAAARETADALDARMGSAETGLAAARETADALDARMGSAETGLAAARETADALDARMGSAETGLAAARETADALDARMGSAETGLAAARETADALDARMGSAETGLAAARETADALDARMGSAETGLAAARETADALDARMGSAETGLAAARETADALDARMGSAETGLAAARETADALDARMGSAETGLAAARELADALDARMGSAETGLAAARELADALDARIGSAEEGVGPQDGKPGSSNRTQDGSNKLTQDSAQDASSRRSKNVDQDQECLVEDSDKITEAQQWLESLDFYDAGVDGFLWSQHASGNNELCT